MPRIMHACGHAYTPGLWLSGCPWCAMAPKQDTPISGRYFDTHEGGAYVSGARLLADNADDPELRDILAAMKSGQTVTIGGGAAAEVTITRVL